MWMMCHALALGLFAKPKLTYNAGKRSPWCRRREALPLVPDLFAGPKPKPVDFDLNPAVIMMKGGGPFVISQVANLIC
jgi:hypothetical protein